MRLELARACYAAGRDEKARYHFGSALADELPSSVEAAVEGFLRRIDARRRWSISFSAAILPETNPARRTKREIVSIGGAPFRLNPDARASSGVGGFVSAGFSFSPTVAEDLRAVLAISTAAKVYRQWNDVTVSGEAGAARLFDGGSAAGGLRFGHRRVGGDSHYRSIGPWTRTALRLSKSARLDLPLNVEYRRHDTHDGHDGWRVTSVPRLLYALDGRTEVETEPRGSWGEDSASPLPPDWPAVLARFRGRAVRRPFRRIPAACRPQPAVRQETVRQENPVEREGPAPFAAIPRVRAVCGLFLRNRPFQHIHPRIPESRGERLRYRQVLTPATCPSRRRASTRFSRIASRLFSALTLQSPCHDRVQV